MSEARCPICESRATTAILELGEVPVFCNVLWPSSELARDAPRGPLRLVLCEDCGLIWNASFEPALLAYDGGYENSLHFSPTFQQYAERLAARLLERYGLRGKTVVEIGSGRGDFLRMLCDGGRNRGIGFDPAYDGPEAPTGDIRLVRDVYSRDYADLRADLVCCRHVLEHVAEPRAFVATIRELVDGGVLYVEVPAAEYMLETGGVWDVIYEHCSFFTEPALRRLLEASGFEVLASGREFGGQYLWAEARAANVAVETPSDVSGIVRQSRAFATRCRGKVDEAVELLDGRRPGSVALWGAGSKGVTFLNLVETGTEAVSVFDVNPRKQGRYIAGAGHPVLAPERLNKDELELVLITNPLYRGEVAERIAQTGSKAEVVLV